MDSIKRVVAKRQMRKYQEHHRGIVGGGPQTKFENAAMIAALMSADLSEGQVAKALGVDRLAVRQMRDDVLRFGCDLAQALIVG